MQNIPCAHVRGLQEPNWAFSDKSFQMFEEGRISVIATTHAEEPHLWQPLL